jgi:hypothetical protein
MFHPRMNASFLFLTLTVAGIAGCASSDEPTASKQEARVTKADWLLDLCATNGWYSDTICDDFCPMPDPDCAVPNNDCEQAGGSCLEGLVANCPGQLVPAALSCGDHPIEMTCCAPAAPSCPDICTAICAGEPEPQLPSGCPIPTCDC